MDPLASPHQNTLPSTIDFIAQTDPERTWVSIPLNDDNISEGFSEIPYKQFADAIDRAAYWLDEELGNECHKTFAYVGPKDLRYAILTIATAKTTRCIVLPSPFATKEAQLHVLKKAGVSLYLRSDSHKELVDGIINENPEITSHSIPEQDDWLNGEVVKPYAFEKSWEEARNDPWVIFHTSGTTGLPKPIVYTHQLMTTWSGLTAENEALLTHRYVNQRVYSPLPALHIVGMTLTLQMIVFLHATLVLGPATKQATASITSQVFKYGKVTAALLPPYILEDLASSESHLSIARSLEFIGYGGAPLPSAIAEKFAPYTILINVGTMGVSFLSYPYELKVLPSYGKSLRGNFIRDDSNSRWQQIFILYPECQELATKDLFSKHPSLWKYEGRMDDWIILSLGECLKANGMEEIIYSGKFVKGVIVGGEGRKRPFALVELTEEGREKNVGVDDVWESVEEANKTCSCEVRIVRELVALLPEGREFKRTVKGTIPRRQNLKEFEDVIEGMYQRYEGS